MQVSTFVNNTHFLFVVANNFNEVTHNIREESNSTKHDNNSNDSLIVTDWIIISVTHSTKCCKSIVTTDDELMCLVFLVKFVFLDERVRLSVVVNGTEHKPDAADEISDDDSDDNKSKDLVNIQHHILGHNLFIPRLVAH